MTWAVRFEEVTKRYRTGSTGYASLREDLARLGGAIIGRRRATAVAHDSRVALDKVSFEVAEGEAFALIGPNGAGKTTALKLLSRISYPTGGRIRVRGRVGALIEVGSGIHPELNGRENIWLYGRIMGMSQREISKRFDEIVEFAELGDVLDMPVKRYSTGMQLRLGFSIASHLEPDIFVVDEALAVGDAGFQAKCTERMMGLVAEGRTLLFVSHNLAAVESLCPRGLFLRDGRVVSHGNTKDVLRAYLSWTDEKTLQRKCARPLQSKSTAVMEISRVTCHAANGREQYEFTSDEPLEIRVHLRTRQPVHNPHINLGITDGRPGLLIQCSTLIHGEPPEHVAGEWIAACRIEKLNLMPRVYRLWADVYSEHGHGLLCDWQEIGAFRVIGMEPSGRVNGKQAVTAELLGAALKSNYEWAHSVE